VKIYLGVDGGGTKTAFVLIDESGRRLAAQTAGPAYYLETGWEALRAMLAGGIRGVCEQAAISTEQIAFAFIGLPAYGEDSTLLAGLDAIATPTLHPAQYRCGNDAVCGWAGALAAEDGINLISGTGSMAFGEFAGRTARSGGWGELFSDEGSAYWIAREGLRLFSRMADGREEPGALYQILRDHFQLRADLDLCAAIYTATQRSQLASLAPLVATAARAGDLSALGIFHHAAAELVQLVHAVNLKLNVPNGTEVRVSYSGGMFQQGTLLLEPLLSNLSELPGKYRLTAPLMTPALGAALYAAKLHGAILSDDARRRLQSPD
jgi:N-acetylglucosamine kinase-like BadF-type ATPase